MTGRMHRAAARATTRDSLAVTSAVLMMLACANLAHAAPDAPPDSTANAAGADTTDDAEAPLQPEKKADDRTYVAEEQPEQQPGEIIEIIDRATPGSAQTLDKRQLEQFEYNDVHQVLRSVPGVYMREEDGYGLRPNIGMRGSGAERSAKIALMEDGVLIAPAPYSAPAAYYFPLITRMERVDVVKGPSAIEFGPNTVGGAINMISKSVPRQRSGELDIAAGEPVFNKTHVRYAETAGRLAFLVEGVRLTSDGFKRLDTGGPTGFEKNDLQLKFRLDNDTKSHAYHQLNVKLGLSSETSNETYTGLTDADFARSPYRRYAATQLDRMDWLHLRGQITYRLELGTRFRLVADAYRNDFTRDWQKLDGFNTDRALSDVLSAPDAGSNAVYYAILRGEANSTSEAEMVRLGTNSRDFVSQGLQLTTHYERPAFGGVNEIDAGIRLHYDHVDRYHFHDSYWMTDGTLMAAETPTVVTRDSLSSATALAVYARNKLRLGKLTATAGVRGEYIAHRVDDRSAADDDSDDSYIVAIPGAGVVYQVLPSLGLLAGVHRGFVPVSPGQPKEVDPEASINYEAGLRYLTYARGVELIGFFSDYSNLTSNCTNSTGCLDEQVDDQFNGGAVHVFGVEALGHWEWPVSAELSVPLRATYTFNHSRFRTGFDSLNPQWGQVEIGDQLPYLPRHQLSVQAGLNTKRFQLNASVQYVSAMRDVAGQGDIPTEERVDGHIVVDMATTISFDRWGDVYFNVDNLFRETYMVSRRPYGLRPGKPRLVILGYKNRF